MGLISDADWANYKNIINSVHEDFNQDTISWYRRKSNMQRYGEDDNAESNFDIIPLKCLVQYNAFRTWPTQMESVAGLLDNESMAVFLNVKYLSDNSYANEHGYLNFNPGLDYFIHRGQKYRSGGEILASQAKNEPLHCIVILKRFVIETGEEKF